MPTQCEDCRNWQPFDDADSGWCPVVVCSTDPFGACKDFALRFPAKADHFPTLKE